jgi:hypothetical protein
MMFMTDLERIQRYLATMLNISTVLDDSGTTLYGNNNLITALVVTPHEGNEQKWVLRLSPLVSFDRWANSMCIEEHFDFAGDIYNYLDQCETDIYVRLFETLSQDFKELQDANDVLRDYVRSSLDDDWCE